MSKIVAILLTIALLIFIFIVPHFILGDMSIYINKYIELSFYLASITLPFIGLLALHQIKLMRDDLEYKKDSDKQKMSVKLNAYFVNDICSSYRRVDKLMLECNLLEYDGPIGNFTYLDLASRSLEGGKIYHSYMDAWLTDKGEEVYREMANLIMMLDDYAYHVISNLLDNKLCYMRSGASYFTLVKKLYPYIIYHLDFGKEDPNLKNESFLQDLYFLWEGQVKSDLEAAKSRAIDAKSVKDDVSG